MRATGFPEPLVNFYHTTCTAFCMAIGTLTGNVTSFMLDEAQSWINNYEI
jgi:hypothetical protein